MTSSDAKTVDTSAEKKDTFTFTLILGGFDELTEEIENALFEAGCDDALLGIHCGKPYLEFDREASSLKDAIISAIRDVQKANKNITIVKVQPPGMDVIDMVNDLLRIREESKSDRSFLDDAWQLIMKDS
ncbi:MAG: hypothetical protein KDA84_08595 [Planctomycetaceae bacterium]|nr:hypothetical protein [Planctomycetaceae bacterium]